MNYQKRLILSGLLLTQLINLSAQEPLTATRLVEMVVALNKFQPITTGLTGNTDVKVTRVSNGIKGNYNPEDKKLECLVVDATYWSRAGCFEDRDSGLIELDGHGLFNYWFDRESNQHVFMKKNER